MISSDTHKLEQVLTNVMNNIAQGVVMFDSTKKLVVWNDQYKNILQFPDEILKAGRPNWDLANFLAKRGDFGDGDPDTLTEERLEMLWGGKSTRSTIKICEQKSYDVRFISTPDFGLVITYTDVTAEIANQAELQIQKDTLADLIDHKDHLFSVIGHDLKNPFGTVISFNELLLLKAKDIEERDNLDKVQEYAQIIHDGAKAANTLLDDLLTWARKQINHLPFAPKDHEINPILDKVIEIYSSDLKHKNINIHRNGNNVTAFIDVDMISTVARNIIGNAIKFSHPGGAITIEVRELENKIHLSFRDKGVGMPDAKIRSFNSLNTLESTPGTIGEMGSGFGLAIAKDYVAKHKGSIEIESEIGKGTIFRIILPKAQNTT